MIIACPESTKRLAQRERDSCEGYRVSRTAQSLRAGFLTTRSSAGRLMGLWMRSFGDRGAAIVEAESMILARLRIAVKGLIGASLFVGGCQIDPEFIPLYPDESIGRRLTRGHTSELLELLKHGPPRRHGPTRSDAGLAGARTSQLKGSGRPRRPKPQSAMWPRQQILL